MCATKVCFVTCRTVDNIQEQWTREKQLQIQQMEQQYDKSVSCVGEGHRQAAEERIVCLFL
jgi:hypothetical protein